MKLTHGELRGLTALAILLAIVLWGIWLTERRIAPGADRESVEAVRNVLEKSDSVEASGEVVDPVKAVEGKKGRKTKRRQSAAKPVAAPRKSPLDDVNV